MATSMLNNQRVDFPFPWLPKGKSERETGACSFAHILLRQTNWGTHDIDIHSSRKDSATHDIRTTLAARP